MNVPVLLASSLLLNVSTPGPSPDEALRLLQVTPAYRIELAACEPETIDPIAAHFDETGRMWVVEMGDYPYGPGADEKAQGRVRALEDRDGDGRFETSRLFEDGLLFPTGCAPWRGGLYVTSMRQVLYLKDEDGDGRADRRDVIFEGFKDENNQLLPNHPTWAIDNHFYIANGLRATDVRRGGSKESIQIGGRDLRFDPLTGRVDAVAGMSQFGLAFDDEGARFLCSNRNHNQHVVIEARYAERVPGVALGALVADTPDHEAAARIYAVSRNWTTSNLHHGTFTAACGVHIYRGDLMPGLKGDAFTCDPTGNLVHRDKLRRSGGTFVASRVESESEILRSPQEWFRPVNLATGLDGALYIVDMCRATIEHPHWMPPEQVSRADFEAGRDRGRIWRLVPADAPVPSQRPPSVRLDQDTLAVLVERLAHSNGVVRETAQRLLVEGGRGNAPDPGDLVARLLKAAQFGALPLTRLHALWTLQGLGALAPSSIEAALGDPDAGVRRAALRLAEPLLATNDLLGRGVLRLLEDLDAGVRFQAVLTAGDVSPNLALEPLTRVACGDLTDHWLRVAILCSAREPEALAARVLMRGAAPDAGRVELMRELVRVSVTRPRSILAALACVTTPDAARWRRLVVLSLLAAGLDRARLPPRQGELVAEVLRAAAVDARTSSLDLVDRVEATRLLGFGDPASPDLDHLLRNAPEPEQRIAAARALATTGREQALTRLVSGLTVATPPVRRAMIEAILSRSSGARILVAGLHSGAVRSTELEPAERSRLLHHQDPEVKQGAEAVMGRADPDRAQVIARYQEALGRSADLTRGEASFQRLCSTCHRVGELGVDTGPDISDTRDRSAESLLVDILDPNRAIDGRYVSYTCATTDGRVVTGVIDAETATAVTFKMAEGRRETIPRSEISSLESAGQSLMPDGLEKELSVTDMADLIAYLKGWRYPSR